MLPDPVLSVDQLATIVDEAFPGSSGYVVENVTDAGVRIRLEVEERHGRPGGTISGPAVMGLADLTAWLSILSRIGPVVLAVTTSLHIDFLRKPSLSDLVASGELIKLGRRLAVVDVSVRSSGLDDLVAKALVTYSLPPRHED